METLKGFFWKPDPAEQLKKCNNLIRTNVRQLDRQIYNLKSLESKTKLQIQNTSRRRTASGRATNSTLEVRLLARELVRIRKQHTRLNTSKAQLESVGMQVREAFSVRKIEGSIKASTKVMKDVNTLIRLPELTGTMRELSTELMKAGIIDEMVGDMIPDVQEMDEEDEAEEEVDRVLTELIGGKLGEAGVVVDPDALPEVPEPAPQVAVDDQADLEEMRSRLQALKS
ncbi:hypothetical protein ABW19_dt0205846 [Dactylella cylindrospora]|nr:hypothetical protein ABW19_dt0205846 [Dactylella cylindrospora]